MSFDTYYRTYYDSTQRLPTINSTRAFVDVYMP